MAAPADEILVDARWLEPPQPMEQVLHTLALLQPGQHIRLLLHRQPFPLYVILDSRGYRHDTAAQADGSYVILIRPAPGGAPRNLPAAQAMPAQP